MDCNGWRNSPAQAVGSSDRQWLQAEVRSGPGSCTVSKLQFRRTGEQTNAKNLGEYCVETVHVFEGENKKDCPGVQRAYISHVR